MTILALSESNIVHPHPCEKKQKEDKELQKFLALNHLVSRTTNELEDLTINLQKRVQEEVVKNEEKDILLNLSQAQAEVGYMLEMIAHQWRQPLSAISSLASTINLKNEMNILSNTDIEDLSNQILELSNFASQTIEDFRELFKPQQKLQHITLSQLITKVQNILKSLFAKHSITIKEAFTCCQEDTLSIPLGQTLQVLINILKNAVDMMSERKSQTRVITFHISQTEEFYILAIEDTAGGIPPEIMPKIFDKRFSTKNSAHGTGLGLDICKSIVEKNLHGHIYATNGEHGAIFEIHIPKD